MKEKRISTDNPVPRLCTLLKPNPKEKWHGREELSGADPQPSCG